MIALINHARKVILKIINNRLKSFLISEISEDQTGFMPRKGTKEQILNVRQFNSRLIINEHYKISPLFKW